MSNTVEELESEIEFLKDKLSRIYDACHPEDEDLLGDALHDVSCICMETNNE